MPVTSNPTKIENNIVNITISQEFIKKEDSGISHYLGFLGILSILIIIPICIVQYRRRKRKVACSLDQQGRQLLE